MLIIQTQALSQRDYYGTWSATLKFELVIITSCQLVWIPDYMSVPLVLRCASPPPFHVLLLLTTNFFPEKDSVTSISDSIHPNITSYARTLIPCVDFPYPYSCTPSPCIAAWKSTKSSVTYSPTSTTALPYMRFRGRAARSVGLLRI